MDIDEALKVANDFNAYLNSSDEKIIKKYSRKELLMALNKISSIDRNKLWYKAMEDRASELGQKNKIILKDYIGYVLGAVSIFVAILLSVQKQELVENRQQVNQYIQIIQQKNYYNELPSEIKVQIENIAAATSDMVEFIGNK